MFKFVKPTTIDIMNRRTVVIIIAFLRCTIGPGESTTLMQRAPKESVIPYCNMPNCAIIKEGHSTPIVIRKPSAK